MSTFFTWCRRHLGWSSSRRSWEERIGTLGLVAGAVALWWYQSHLAPLLTVLLWAILLVVAAVLLRRGWLKLFGPVLFYDMVRSARRGRYILMRCAYALLLLFLLWMVYHNAWRPRDQDLAPSDAARVAESYFHALIFVQFLAVLLLTPAYVAGAIADEKTHKTLEFILATDLRSREIVLSKLCSRLANLGILILTGLPVLSFLQFLGGVDPNLVLAGFAGTGLTMLGLGGISILTSTYCKRPRDAIAIAYLVLFAYYAVAIVSLIYQGWLRSLMPVEPLEVWLRDRTVDLLDAWNSGNLGLIVFELGGASDAGTLATVIPALLRKYALFQGVVAAVTIGWSVWRLRPVAVRQMSRSQGRRRRGPLGFRRRRRAAVGDLPMVWKEISIEGGLRLHWIAWGITFLVAVVTFLPAASIIYWHWLEGHRNIGYGYNIFQSEMNGWARAMTIIVCAATHLAVAVRAATCISGERDRQTMESLLTTPLTAREILSAKVMGNVLSVRIAWLWLGGVWLLALATGGIHPFALPCLLWAWLVYAFFLSVLGSWFSVVSRSSQRAIVYTLLATVGLAVGHWLPWLCCLTAWGRGDDGLAWIAKFQGGLTPPFALGVLTFQDQDFRPYYGPHSFEQLVGFSVCGLFVWTCGAFFLWSITLQRFREMTQRGTEDLLSRYDQPYHHGSGRRRHGLPGEASRPGAVDERILAQELIEVEDEKAPGLYGARLVEEIREIPPQRPSRNEE